jgi:hypothetical protein
VKLQTRLSILATVATLSGVFLVLATGSVFPLAIPILAFALIANKWKVDEWRRTARSMVQKSLPSEVYEPPPASPEPTPPSSSYLSLIEIALGDRVSWLAAGQAENPFEFRVLDCREAALVCRSFTTDRAVAESFNRLRLFDGRGLVGQRPQDAVVHEVHLHFPLQSRAGEGPMFKAQVMEDRWDIYLFGNEVYLTCSWTGELIHAKSPMTTTTCSLPSRHAPC